MARPAVILDRDGTLIDFVRDPDLGVVTPAFHPDQLRFLPGVIAGLRRLAAAGYDLFVATNQPGAAKGELPRAAIERTNEALLVRLRGEGVPLHAVLACLHHPEGGEGGDASLVAACRCRKPGPEMFERLTRAFGLDPARSWGIGDTPTDVRAAQAAGFRAVLVTPQARCELCPLRDAPTMGVSPDLWASRFDDAVTQLLAADAPLPPLER